MFGRSKKEQSESQSHRLVNPTSDWRDASVDDGLYGLSGGTLVLTREGWRPAEAIGVGDMVLTFDHGLKKVVAVTHNEFETPDQSAPEFAVPVTVPARAVGNTTPMVLLPEETVMLESDAAERLTGEPFALLPVPALVGYHGVERVYDLPPFEIVTLHFERDEVIFVNGGALVFAPAPILGDPTLEFLEEAPERATYTVLHRDVAKEVIRETLEDEQRASSLLDMAAAAG